MAIRRQMLRQRLAEAEPRQHGFRDHQQRESDGAHDATFRRASPDAPAPRGPAAREPARAEHDGQFPQQRDCLAESRRGHEHPRRAEGEADREDDREIDAAGQHRDTHVRPC